jgi:hypothetical protein
MLFCNRYVLFLRTKYLFLNPPPDRGRFAIKQEVYYSTELKFA